MEVVVVTTESKGGPVLLHLFSPVTPLPGRNLWDCIGVGSDVGVSLPGDMDSQSTPVAPRQIPGS